MYGNTHTHTHTTLIAKAILRKKNGTGGINLPDVIPCLQSYRHKKKKSWYWQKDRNTDKWNKLENPAINPHSMDTLSLTKEAEIYNGQRTSLKIDAGKNGQPLQKKDARTLSTTLYHNKLQKD